MRILLLVLSICLLFLLTEPTVAQSNDTATERARIANERIRLDAARRAQAQQERQQQAAEQVRPPGETAGTTNAAEQTAGAATSEEQTAGAQTAGANIDAGQGSPAQQSREAPVAVAAPVTTTPQTPPPVANSDLTEALAQLRKLGELKDAGYVTDEEFDRIKARILDSQF